MFEIKSNFVLILITKTPYPSLYEKTKNDVHYQTLCTLCNFFYSINNSSSYLDQNKMLLLLYQQQKADSG